MKLRYKLDNYYIEKKNTIGTFKSNPADSFDREGR